MSKILTPAEVRAQQTPHVAAHVARINDGLIQGRRIFWVPGGIAAAVGAELDGQGWCTKVGPTCKYSDSAAITVIEDRS